jgi:hypothetical protein
MTELSARDQQVLRSSLEPEPAPDRRESVRLAVARHRARKRLRVLLDGLAGSATLWWGRRSRLWSASAEAMASAAVPVAAGVLITIAGWSAPSHEQLDRSVARARPPQLELSVHDLSTPTTGPTPVATGSAGSSPTASSPADTSALIPNTVITLPGADGDQGRVGIRPKQDTDHVACVTPPPTLGQPTQCFDPPFSVGLSLP